MNILMEFEFFSSASYSNLDSFNSFRIKTTVLKKFIKQSMETDKNKHIIILEEKVNHK